MVRTINDGLLLEDIVRGKTWKSHSFYNRSLSHCSQREKGKLKKKTSEICDNWELEILEIKVMLADTGMER